MTIKILQLNIEKGRFLDAVVGYIRRHLFDIVCLQEVAGGRLASQGKNCYETITAFTGMHGELAVYLNIKGDTSSFIGNATLFRNELHLAFSHTIWLKPYQEKPDPKSIDFRNVARCALATILTRGGKEILVVNTHLAWGPTPNDALYKRNQAEKLYRWIKRNMNVPFLLSGDFNLNPQTKIVTSFSSLGVNLTKKYRITNTLNPRFHYAKNLFPSGLPVDYIIADRRLKVNEFYVEEKADLSDHYGLVAEICIDK